MTPAEQLAALRLIRTDSVGPVGFRHLLRRFGSAAAAVEALPDIARRNSAALTPFPRDAAEAEMEQVAALGARHLHLAQAAYPAQLAATPDAPPVLIVKGDMALAGRPMVAMVGARNASAAGRTLARGIAQDLGAAGFVIVSGMARGIDAAAHEGALPSGTIACIAGGIDIAYPPENHALQQAVGETGLLLAEQPPGIEPQARHFPRRNRLIVGLAEGVLVVEAAAGSGSLISARLAGDYGREVMAVPGHPADPRSHGGNRLLRDGAALVENAADVLAVLRPFASLPVAAPLREPVLPLLPDTPANDLMLFELLGAPVAVDELVRQSGLSAAMVMSMLADMELDGRIARHAGGRVSRA